MKLSSDSSVLRLTHEVMTNFVSLSDSNKKSIENLPSFFKNIIPAIEADATNIIAAEASFAGAKIYSISIRRLISAVNADNHYGSISRVTNPQKFNM